jgi:hypothetical protein
MSVTRFPHGISSSGMPMNGGLPPTFGNTWYVDYANGSDNNEGTETTKAFKTLSKAHSACTTNNNDYILINGYSEIVETAMVDFTKSRVHVVE